jgi:hypothetical protein
MSDESEPQMPEVARRKGAKDTLFSADWYDDDDDFGKMGGGDAEPPASSGPAKFTPEAKAAPKKGISAPVDAPAEGGSNRTMLIVGVLVVGVVLGGGLVGVAGVAALYLFVL